jgi:polysaccharide biosynthesis/export protein ExoF
MTSERARRVWTPMRLCHRSAKNVALCALLISGGSLAQVRGADVGLAVNSTKAPQTEQNNLISPETRPRQSPRRVSPTVMRDVPGSLMSQVDSVSIKFQGQPSLNGEYRVSGDETISIPVIGRYSVSGLNLSGFEELLASEFSRVTGTDVMPTVEVVSYREVAVTGFVNHPGEHRWKRGMTVRHAEALAGGLFRPTNNSGATLAFDAELKRARRAAADVARLTIQLARLKAEYKGEQDFAAPSAKGVVSEAEAHAIVASQKSSLKSRRAAYDARTLALTRAQALSASERERLTQQRASVEKMIANRRTFVGALKDIAGRRPVLTQERLFTEQARLDELEDRHSSIIHSIKKAENDDGGFARELAVNETKYKAEIDAEIQTTERELAQFEIELTLATSSFQAISGKDALTLTEITNRVPQAEYRIIRNVGGESTNITAKSETPLMPGDVLVISVAGGLI